MQKIAFNNPLLHCLLNSVEKPARYTGGEYARVKKLPNPEDYSICVVFPDLYEIGMSNQAIRILYNSLNNTKNLHAERAFYPEEDFYKGLRKIGLPLYSLENGFHIKDFDFLAIHIGSELSFTNYLGFLHCSDIPLRSNERKECHPLIVIGGPAITNPLPWTNFIDAAFIGESETNLVASILELRNARNQGASKEELKQKLADFPGFWTPNSPKTKRQVWMGFSEARGIPPAYPIPSLEPVQDHGVIEIMRGCPNKCRFCHAGVFYRPFRQKTLERIVEEAQFLVEKCGYRNISLSSLSTGDYQGLEPLIKYLNAMFASRKISFGLPSLRVNSITLSLIGNLGVVRKSGLTFAVETPNIKGQRGINKEVPANKVVEILKEARREGWKLAKFYFMLGLPVSSAEDDTVGIVNYLQKVQQESRMKLNVNLATFIPKPHTPFEREAQLTEEESLARIHMIRNGLKTNRNIRISYHSPFMSFLDGIISRGDSRAGDLAHAAWLNGAQFDAWNDKINMEAWRKAISDAPWNVEEISCSEREIDSPLPWQEISLGVSQRHLKSERNYAKEGKLTKACSSDCSDRCGVCNKDCQVRVPQSLPPNFQEADSLKSSSVKIEPTAPIRRLLLTYSKKEPAIYLGHLDMMRVFEKSLQRAGVKMLFTQGYNPKPRIEFAQALPLGFYSEQEICSVYLHASMDADSSSIKSDINKSFPSGIRIIHSDWIPELPEGRKSPKVMNTFWGSEWRISLREGLELSKTQDYFDKLDEILLQECEVRGIEKDIRILRNNKDWFVQFRNGGTRHHNLKRLLEHIIGESPLKLGWMITRTASLAKSKNGCDEPVSYRSSFTESQ